MNTDFINMIEEGKALEAHEVLSEALTDKAADFLVEKRKQIVAKTFGKSKVTGKDEKTIFKAGQRKALRDKMKSLNSVKK